jgi:hypothetical protein
MTPRSTIMPGDPLRQGRRGGHRLRNGPRHTLERHERAVRARSPLDNDGEEQGDGHRVKCRGHGEQVEYRWGDINGLDAISNMKRHSLSTPQRAPAPMHQPAAPAGVTQGCTACPSLAAAVTA